MRSLKTILALILFMLVTTTFVFSDDSKVRVTTSKANIRLRPNTQSTIVSTVPLGAVLEVISKEGNWYFVKLPPDEKGIIVTGYIHQNIVEVLEEIERPVEPKNEDVEKKEKKPQEIMPKPVEIKKDLSKNPNYLKWKAEYNKAEADFLKWEKYRKIGKFTSYSITIGLPLLVVLTKEFSLLPGTGLTLVGIGGAVLWMHANGKKNAAAERILLLTNRGKTKGWTSFHINPIFNPAKKIYALSVTVTF